MSIKWTELPPLQALPLKEKVERAVEWMRKGFEVSQHAQSIAFSGGKDSTVLCDLQQRFLPEYKPYVIFGNTGVEYPESLKFARQYGREHYGDRFIEAKPAPLERDHLKYKAQREVMEWLEREGRIHEVLKADGKLKKTETLEDAATPEMWEDFRKRNLVWRKGTPQSYWYCIDQYGFPILGKAACKLDARRINIDCFLKYSKTESDREDLKEYYDLIRQVKISQHCCTTLKKEPAHRIQQEIGVDCVFMGMMASESRRRMISYCNNGELYQTFKADTMKDGSPVWHCHPMGIWTDDDVWEYIHKYNVPYSPLYDVEYPGLDGRMHKIERNGCFGCATTMAFADNQIRRLRQTHPKLWRLIMDRGMAEELRNLRIARANGQVSMLERFDTDILLDLRPCAFDSIDDVIMMDGLPKEYDADLEEDEE